MISYLATTGNRKVHFEFAVGQLTGLPSCNNGGPVIERLAELDEDGGIDQLIEALTAAQVASSRLCGHCFAIRTRIAYSAHLATIAKETRA